MRLILSVQSEEQSSDLLKGKHDNPELVEKVVEVHKKGKIVLQKRKVLPEDVKTEKTKKETKPVKEKGDNKEGKEKKEKKAPNPWRVKYGHLKLTMYPPADMVEGDINEGGVRVNMQGDINGHSVLTWRNPKGKQQDAYTDVFYQNNQKDKWERVNKHFSEEGVASTIKKCQALLNNPDEKISQCAAVVDIIAQTGLRVGNRNNFKGSGNRGVTTLTADNFSLNGDKVTMNFVGKEYVENNSEFKDKQVSKYLAKRAEKVSDNAAFLFSVTDTHVNKFLREKLGYHEDVSIKDFRTFVACKVAKDILYNTPVELPNGKTAQAKYLKGHLKEVFINVANKLNNTPGVAKDSYVHPEIIKSWLHSVGAHPELIDGLVKATMEEQIHDTPTMESIIAESDYQGELYPFESGYDEVDAYPVPSWWDDVEEEEVKKGEAEQNEAMRHPDKLGAGAKKRKKLKNKKDKVAVVMKEFGRGTLRSGSGDKVTDRKQAIAIAMSEAGLSKGEPMLILSIEKGGKGAGSRGGKIIGYTKNGHPVYESGNKPEKTKHWKAEDFADAWKHHAREYDTLKEWQKDTPEAVFPGEIENHKKQMEHYASMHKYKGLKAVLTDKAKKYIEKAESEKQLGLDIEKEHADTIKFIRDYYKKNGKFPPDKVVFAKIVDDHLDEFKNYYTKLKEMEETLGEDKIEKAIDIIKGKHYEMVTVHGKDGKTFQQKRLVGSKEEEESKEDKTPAKKEEPKLILKVKDEVEHSDGHKRGDKVKVEIGGKEVEATYLHTRNYKQKNGSELHYTTVEYEGKKYDRAANKVKSLSGESKKEEPKKEPETKKPTEPHQEGYEPKSREELIASVKKQYAKQPLPVQAQKVKEALEKYKDHPNVKQPAKTEEPKKEEKKPEPKKEEPVKEAKKDIKKPEISEDAKKQKADREAKDKKILGMGYTEPQVRKMSEETRNKIISENISPSGVSILPDGRLVIVKREEPKAEPKKEEPVKTPEPETKDSDEEITTDEGETLSDLLDKQKHLKSQVQKYFSKQYSEEDDSKRQLYQDMGDEIESELNDVNKKIEELQGKGAKVKTPKATPVPNVEAQKKHEQYLKEVGEKSKSPISQHLEKMMNHATDGNRQKFKDSFQDLLDYVGKPGALKLAKQSLEKEYDAVEGYMGSELPSKDKWVQKHLDLLSGVEKIEKSMKSPRLILSI